MHDCVKRNNNDHSKSKMATPRTLWHPRLVWHSVKVSSDQIVPGLDIVPSATLCQNLPKPDHDGRLGFDSMDFHFYPPK